MPKKIIVPKEKEYICIIHDDITGRLEDMNLIEFTEATVSEIPELQTQMRASIQQLLVRVKDAKERGIAMERRLLQYRSAMEDLGYIKKNV